MKKKYVYSEYTYNSKNPIARFSHRKRFSVAINLTMEEEFKTILDYGAGDNNFLIELSSIKDNIVLVAFEPIMKIDSTDKIEVISKLVDLKIEKFDVITCFETLEHFNETAQLSMLKEFNKILEKNGRVIISVPIEIGFPSLIKNIRRMSFGKNSYQHIKNSIKCFFGKEIPEIRNLEGFIPSHLGFNHKKLEYLMLKYFKIVKKEKSPFKNLPYQLNSQVFYILEKK